MGELPSNAIVTAGTKVYLFIGPASVIKAHIEFIAWDTVSSVIFTAQNILSSIYFCLMYSTIKGILICCYDKFKTI